MCVKINQLPFQIKNYGLTSKPMQSAEKVFKPKSQIAQMQRITDARRLDIDLHTYCKIQDFVNANPNEKFVKVNKKVDNVDIIYEGKTIDIAKDGRLLQKAFGKA